VLSSVGIALGVTAFLAGLTGTWSPCGFSMVDSLGRGTREGRRAVTLAACAAFAAGALAGGAALFGALGAVGSLLGADGGRPAAVAAFGVAVTGALAELRGVRIRPQIRRQVPEPWRRVLPLPLAAALYGVLLGVGFATFVLTLAVVALAAISLALGDPVLGLAVGAAFGAGRALPVVVLAPASRTAWGARALELMAERPLVLRGFRAADGLALAAAAVALGTGPAWGSRQVARPASDPSVSGDVIAFEDEDGVAVVRSGGSELKLPGSDPAVGGPYVAWRRNDLVTVVDRETRRTVNLTIAGVDALALSRRWVAWRSRSARGDRVGAARLPAGRPLRRVKSISGLGRLGRPALGGDRLAYSVAGRRGSRIVIVNLRTRRRRTAVCSRSRQLLNPSLRGSRLLYVSIGRCGQQLRLRRRGHERVLMRGRPLARTDAGFDRGHTSQGSGYGPCARRFRRTPTMLWTTALGERSAYVTLLRPRAERGGARIVRVGR
jgi:cytochrome c biogenesis protein CcdA